MGFLWLTRNLWGFGLSIVVCAIMCAASCGLLRVVLRRATGSELLGTCLPPPCKRTGWDKHPIQECRRRW